MAKTRCLVIHIFCTCLSFDVLTVLTVLTTERFLSSLRDTQWHLFLFCYFLCYYGGVCIGHITGEFVGKKKKQEKIYIYIFLFLFFLQELNVYIYIYIFLFLFYVQELPCNIYVCIYIKEENNRRLLLKIN